MISVIVYVVADYQFYDCDSSQSCFRCLNASVTIPYEAVCDYVMDCPDLSDEMLCSSRDYLHNFIKNESKRKLLYVFIIVLLSVMC